MQVALHWRNLYRVQVAVAGLFYRSYLLQYRFLLVNSTSSALELLVHKILLELQDKLLADWHRACCTERNSLQQLVACTISCWRWKTELLCISLWPDGGCASHTHAVTSLWDHSICLGRMDWRGTNVTYYCSANYVMDVNWQSEIECEDCMDGAFCHRCRGAGRAHVGGIYEFKIKLNS